MATALFLPLVGWAIAAHGFPLDALPFVAGTSVLHCVYFYALGRAYRSADLSIVYPIARGLGVALVPVVAFGVFHERLSPVGAAGIGLVLAGIVALHLGPRLVQGVSLRLDTGIAWAGLTGLAITAYSLVDKAGVARLHPVAYVGLLGLGMTALLFPIVIRHRALLEAEWRTNWRPILVAASMTLTGYMLVLFAFRLSKVGYVVAARELSIVFSTLLGALWLREGALAPRLLGAMLILGGVVCVALAR